MAIPNITNEEREIIYSGDANYDCRLYINQKLVPIEQIENIKISSPIIDITKDTGSMFHIGTFISQKLTIKFRNLDGLDLQSNPEIKLDIGIFENGAYKYYPIGKYMIDELSEDYQKSCEISCLDYAVKFRTNIDISQFFNKEGYILAGDLFKIICKYYGVEVGTYPTTNNNKQIRLYDSNLSGKQYISYLAELFGGNAKIDRNGRCCIIPLKLEPSKAITIDALSSKKFVVKETYQISRVCYDNGKLKFQAGGNVISVNELPTINIDTGSYYYLTKNLKYYRYSNNKWAEATNLKNTLYIRQDNLFISNEEEIDNIYDVVKGFKITNILCENRGDITLDSWDILKYIVGDKEYYTLNNNELNFNGIVSSKVSINIQSGKKNETTNVTNPSVETKIRNIKTRVDEINGIVETTIEKVDGNTTNISKNTQTINSMSTKLTETTQKTEKVEKELSKTNQNVSDNKASFEDFKNNEYMQNITNLQNQIDGAIQFWNGVEIPTLSNYPANQWTTENERINHTADIYTVIKDINGEMKQGKSYRFDKVKGTWQWIELTDNELSAVKAIADEANKKAKENAKSITTLQEKNVEIDTTLDGIKTSVSKTEKSITTLENIVKKLEVDLETNSIVVAVNSKGIPYNTITYKIAYISKYEGKPVDVIVSTKDSHSGIKVTTAKNIISFSTSNQTAITSNDNIYSFDFAYGSEKVKKAIIISLAKQGNQGLQGETGANGKDGANGKQGPIGPIGPQGPAGEKGETGSQGPKGQAGYTPIKGKDYFDGKNGTNGTNGTNGKDGRSVTSIVEMYYKSTSATALAGGTWSTTYPGWENGKYIWTKSVINYSSGNPDETKPICVSGSKGTDGKNGSNGTNGAPGKDGQNGTNGTNGISVTKVDVWYYLSTSATQLVGGTWSTNAPVWTQGKYMWSKTITSYSKGNPTESKPVCISGSKGDTGKAGQNGAPGKNGSQGPIGPQGPAGAKGETGAKGEQGAKGETGPKGETGAKGKDGKGIKSTAIAYQISASGTAVPTGSWSTSVPKTTAEKPYLWTRTIVTYTDNTSSTSYSVGSTIEGVQVGGRNLLLNSRKLEDWSVSNHTTSIEDGFTVIKFTNSGQTNNTILSLYPKNNISKKDLDEEEIVISFEAKTDDYSKLDNKAIMIIEAYTENNHSTRIGWQDIQISSGLITYDKYKFEHNQWTRFIFKAKINKNLFYYVSGKSYNDVNFIGFRLTLFKNGTLSFKKPKLEKGNKATDWTPAPEDIQGEIDNTNNNLQQVTERVSSVEIETQSNNLSIGILEKEKTTIKNELDKFEENTNNSIQSANENISSLKKQLDLTMTSEQVKLEINKEIAKGTDKVTTSTGFRFDENGLNVSKSGSQMSTQITEDGMSIKRDNREVLKANNNGVDAENLHATTYLIIGKNSRFEDMGSDRTGCFWIGG